MEQFVIMPNLTNLIKTGKGATSASKLLMDFKAIKPTLNLLNTEGQGFFMPCKDAKKQRRDMQFILNKYSNVIGKKFACVQQDKVTGIDAIAADPAKGIVAVEKVEAKASGIWIILADANVTKGEIPLTEAQVEYFGNSLELYISPAPTAEERAAKLAEELAAQELAAKVAADLEAEELAAKIGAEEAPEIGVK